MLDHRQLGRLASRKPDMHQVVQGLLTACYLLVIPVWGPALIEYASLDGSWEAVIAHVAFKEYAFGSDLVYAVGPFGWLRTGTYWPGLHAPLIAWGLFAGVVLAAMCRILLQNLKGRWLISLGFLCALIPVIVNGKLITIFYLMDCLVLFSCLLIDRGGHRVTVILCGVFLSLSSLVYFPQLVAATMTVVIASLLNYARFRAFGVLPPVFFGTFIIWWLLANQHLADLPAYLVTSVEVTRGFEGVMSLTGPAWQIAVPFLTFLAVLCTVLISRRREPLLPTALLAVGLSLVFFIALKGAAVRQQTPRLITPAITVYGMALAQLAWLVNSGSNCGPRLRPLAAAAVGLTLLLNVVLMASSEGGLMTVLGERAGLPLRQAQKLNHLLHDPDHLVAMDLRYRSDIRSRFPLPRITGGVDLFGNRQGILLCHGLDYQPRPVFQSFSAYTPDLAGMNGDFLAGERAPETLIIDLTGFGRILRPQLDSQAFVEILQSYRHIESRGKLAVVERGVRFPFRQQTVLEVTASPGQWIPVDKHSDSGPVWLHVNTRFTMGGRLAGILLKRPQLAIDLQFRDNSGSTFRFAPDVARSGFWLSPTIQNTNQFVEYLNDGFPGIGHDRIVARFRIRERFNEHAWAVQDFRIRAVRLVRSQGGFPPEPTEAQSVR